MGFSVGDRVRIINPGSGFYGMEGPVIDLQGGILPYKVALSAQDEHDQPRTWVPWFDSSELEVVEAP